MDSGLKTGTMLRALFAHFAPENEQSLLRALPTYEFALTEKCTTPYKTDFASLLSAFSWIESIHHSWFLSPLKALPKETAALCLSFFPEENKRHLINLLELPLVNKTPSPLIALFLAEYLKTKVEKEEVLAIVHLPPSPFNKLLDLNKHGLLHLTDLLGLFDLASDIRQIVDKTLLARVYTVLTKEQMQFLTYAMQQPLKYPSTKLNLESWNGDKKTLLSLLHKRGLHRLGQSLKGENKNLQWHIAHKFDTGRGDLLMKLFAVKGDPAMITYFRGQVLQLLTRFKI